MAEKNVKTSGYGFLVGVSSADEKLAKLCSCLLDDSRVRFRRLKL